MPVQVLDQDALDAAPCRILNAESKSDFAPFVCGPDINALTCPGKERNIDGPRTFEARVEGACALILDSETELADFFIKKDRD